MANGSVATGDIYMADPDTTEILCGLTDRYVNQTAAPSPGVISWIDDEPGACDSGSRLIFRCASENAFSYAHQENRQHFLFELKAPLSASGFGRSPLNICICLDRSGSMEGDPLAYAKRACCHIVDLLGPDDVLSIITFAERGEVLVAAQPADGKEALKAAIGRISIGNRTNIHDGLEAAIEQLLESRTPNSLNRILLLSDGEPTAGNKDFQSIVTLVTDRKRDGVKVTALGFGPDYNEELIAALARRTGGNYYYISRAELLPEVFRIEMDALMQTVAREIKLRVNLTRGISVRQVYANDYQPCGARSFEVNLVDVERNGVVTSLWEFDLTPHPAGLFRLGRAEIEYENCAGQSRQSETADMLIEFTRHPKRILDGMNAHVRSEIQIMNAARSLDRTMVELRRGGASSRDFVGELEMTQRLLVKHGQASQAGQIERAITNMRTNSSGREFASVEKTLIGAIVQLDQGKRA